MTALSSERLNYKVGNTERAFPVKGTTTIYQGAMVAINSSGLAVPVTTATGLACVGVAVHTADNSAGADSAINVQVEVGVFPMGNSAGGDAITRASVGDVVYGVDDQTVAKTDDGGTRSAVGTLWNINLKDGKVLVRFE